MRLFLLFPACVFFACTPVTTPDAGPAPFDAGPPPPIPVIDAGVDGPEGPDTDLPFAIDRGDDEGSPGSYLGLPLRLTQNPEPELVVDAGPIGVVCIGGLISGAVCDDYAARLDGELADDVNPRVQVVNCGITGFGLEGLEAWNNSEKDRFLWDVCLGERLAAAGLTPDQVRVVFHRAYNFQTAKCGFQTCEALETYPYAESNYFRLVENLDTFANRVAGEFPALNVVYTSTREQGWFVDPNVWRDEPLTYEAGHALNTWLRENPSRDGVAFAWGPYLWAPDCATSTTNGAEVCWDRSDFAEDGETPTASGLAKISAMIHARLLQSSWYVGAD